MTFPSSSKFHTLERERKKGKKEHPTHIKQFALGLKSSSHSPVAGGNLIYPRGFAPMHFPLVNKLMASTNKKGTGQAYG